MSCFYMSGKQFNAIVTVDEDGFVTGIDAHRDDGEWQEFSLPTEPQLAV